MGTRVPAEVFPPGEFLKDELEARGWTQVEFAEIIGKDTRLVSEVISGKRAVTPETAMALGAALGTSPDVWMNLESQYQLSKVRSGQEEIAQKAELHSRFPVREMVKRGWIESTKNVGVLQQQVLAFFGMASINDEPTACFAAKKQKYVDTPIAQIAWFCRARSLAEAAPAAKFAQANVATLISRLKTHLLHVEGAQSVAGILADAGIRFVVVEALSGSKIDGACFWLDKTSPVIALSLRFDRVDNFWHTLLHEIDHIANKEGMAAPILDTDVLGTEGDSKPEFETRANENAAENLVPRAELDGFIARVNPMFTEDQIVGFARRVGVHPGIVIGQLQNRRLIPWTFHRRYLEKIREYVIVSALTDGFGHRVAGLA
jgi:HTH-type transcriptional regulator/antitoxin HigA